MVPEKEWSRGSVHPVHHITGNLTVTKTGGKCPGHVGVEVLSFEKGFLVFGQAVVADYRV